MNLYIVLGGEYGENTIVAAETAADAIAVITAKVRLYHAREVHYVAWELSRGTRRTQPGRVYGLTPDSVCVKRMEAE